ncbi:hypothetical protein EDD85DRAFT_796467 [Armillaria nabsnona]|nr:hypothetical protein EDD85DRAFT_796467 [Armillaria nabsnona]
MALTTSRVDAQVWPLTRLLDFCAQNKWGKEDKVSQSSGGVGVVTGARSQSGMTRSTALTWLAMCCATKARTILIARLHTSCGVETPRGVHCFTSESTFDIDHYHAEFPLMGMKSPKSPGFYDDTDHHHALKFIPIPIDIGHHLGMGGAIEGGTSHDDDDQHDNGAGGDGHALMQGPIWKKDAGERGHGWRALEGGRCRGRRWDKDEDANGQQQQ